MIELLKTLNENNLLTPIATMFTGSIAVIAVLINNWCMRHNLNLQIEAQSRDSDKKIINEKQVLARKEKQLKLESLHENLQQFLETLNDCHKESLSVAWRNTGSYGMKFNDLSKIRDSYAKGQSYNRKALILGYSYSDSEELSFTLDELKVIDEAIKRAFNKLTNSFAEAEEVGADLEQVNNVTSENTEDLLTLVVQTQNKIERIEKLVTQEIRATRS
ncbi:hypothetical protein [Vibrio alginolyticus]|uniref:hypothetical protein n=1 Tax=Vibrio alginolyticus TaxID=663 RepID=UPI003754DE56